MPKIGTEISINPNIQVEIKVDFNFKCPVCKKEVWYEDDQIDCDTPEMVMSLKEGESFSCTNCGAGFVFIDDDKVELINYDREKLEKEAGQGFLIMEKDNANV